MPIPNGLVLCLFVPDAKELGCLVSQHQSEPLSNQELSTNQQPGITN